MKFFKILKYTFLTLASVSFYSSVSLYWERYCNKLDDLNIRSCSVASKISFPSRLLLDGYFSTKKIILSYLRTGNILTTDNLTLSPESDERFKELNPGFNFYYKVGSRNKAGYILISKADPKTGGSPSVEIWDLNKQKKIHSYNFNFNKIKKIIDIGNEKHIQFYHPLLLDDGSLITSLYKLTTKKLEYGPLIKFNACGEIKEYNDKYIFHHSIEQDKFGFLYVPIKDAFDDLNKNDHLQLFENDGFVILNRNLKLIKKYSMLDIYKKNGLINDIYGIGENYQLIDPFHLNDVQPHVMNDNSIFALLSLRNQSSIIGLNLENKKISWKIENASFQQHDVDVIASTKNTLNISFFDNNVWNFKTKRTKGNKNVYLYDLPLNNKDIEFVNKESKFTKYKLRIENFEKLPNKFKPITITSGLSDHNINNNSLMIEETGHGHIFEIEKDTGKLLWQYINKSKEDNVNFRLSWSRRLNNLPNDFTKSAFSKCNK